MGRLASEEEEDLRFHQAPSYLPISPYCSQLSDALDLLKETFLD